MLPICILIVGCVFLVTGIFDLKLFFKKLYGHFVHLLHHTKEVVSVYVRYPLILVMGLGLTIFLQSAVIVSLWGIGRSFGIQTPIQYYFVFFPMMWVIGSLPFDT